MKEYIGVDLGGTNVRAAKVDENGKIIQIIKEATEINLGCEHVINKIISMIKSLDNFDKCEGIGIGVPGPVDTKNGKMVMATNLPGFEGYPIVSKIEEATNLKCYLDNDVNVAALGEAYFGAGKNSDSLYYITISTGIGGAFVFNHQLVSGSHGYAGEVGNIIIDPNREKTTSLNAGAIEAEASGTAITRKGKEVFGNNIINNAGDVFNLAKDNNDKALQITKTMQEDLGTMLANIAHVVDPEIFVFGGGCMKSKDLFYPQMIENFKTKIHVGMRETKVVEAALDEPGIIGAAMLAHK